MRAQKRYFTGAGQTAQRLMPNFRSRNPRYSVAYIALNRLAKVRLTVSVSGRPLSKING